MNEFTAKNPHTEINRIFSEARKTPAYKSELMLIEFWEAVISAMNDRKMSMSQLSKKSGIPVKRLGKWKSDGEGMTLADAGKILSAVGLTIYIVSKNDRIEKN